MAGVVVLPWLKEGKEAWVGHTVLPHVTPQEWLLQQWTVTSSLSLHTALCQHSFLSPGTLVAPTVLLCPFEYLCSDLKCPRWYTSKL